MRSSTSIVIELIARWVEQISSLAPYSLRFSRPLEVPNHFVIGRHARKRRTDQGPIDERDKIASANFFEIIDGSL